MKNTNCPLVKSQQKSKLVGQKDKQAGGLRIALLASFIVGAFALGSLTAHGLSSREMDAERLQTQIQSLKSETQAVTASQSVVSSKLVADL